MEEEESSVEQQDKAIESGAAANYGFQPAEPEKPPEQPKLTDTPACKALREVINAMLSRYPEIELRSTEMAMKQLEQYDEKELTNILNNIHHDLDKVNGTPSARLAVGIGTMPLDHYVPGYTERCMNDTRLCSDIGHEMQLLFGTHSNRANILYRLMNHLWDALYYPDAPYADELVEEAQQRAEEERVSKHSKKLKFPPPDEPERQTEETQRHRKRARRAREEDSASD